MQYCIWGEMLVVGLYESITDPPTSMFPRAGGGSASIKKNNSSSNDVAKAITQIASALAPSVGTHQRIANVCSPAKIIENRSRCYKQLSRFEKFIGFRFTH